MISLDTNLLLGYYQARNGLSAAVGGTSTNVAASKAKAPTPPWSTLSAAPKADEMLKSVMMGRKFIDEYQTQLDVKGASEDYRQLFAIHQGLSTLEALARKADDKDTTAAELKRIQASFTRGMAEVSGYIDDANFEKLRLTYGDVADKGKTAVGVPKTVPKYMTSTLHQGTATDAVEAFQGDMKFSVKIRLPNKVEKTIDFDLAEMGSTTRSMNEVVKYINTKLSGAGFSTRFAVEKIAGAEKTTEVNGRTIKLGNEPDKFALKIQGDTT